MPNPKIVNVASVPHRSPFRYPGGKTWLVPRIRLWLSSLDFKPKTFIEPFAGGAICGLTAICEDLVEETSLVELDESVGAVWQTIVDGYAPELADRIEKFDVSLDNVRQILDRQPTSVPDRAFTCIIRNRMQRGGIMAPGASLMKSGENGKGLTSRWYPQTLKRRLLDLHQVRHRISFTAGDGVEYLRESVDPESVAFVDPPYKKAGGRLYLHGEVDHAAIFAAVVAFPGDFLMTYENSDFVKDLASKHGLDVEPISMKNTHHAVMSELLVGRNLDWSR